jgi:hypothetical protein
MRDYGMRDSHFNQDPKFQSLILDSQSSILSNSQSSILDPRFSVILNPRFSIPHPLFLSAVDFVFHF